MPAINPQITPRHKRARLRDQKHRRSSILLRLAQPAQHILLRPLGLALRVLHEQLHHHGRHDVTWGNGVDADTMFAPFHCKVARELEDSGFRSVVRGADQTLWERLSVQFLTHRFI